MSQHRALNDAELTDGLLALMIRKGITPGEILDDNAPVQRDRAVDPTQGHGNRDPLRTAEDVLLEAIKRAARC